VETFACGVWKTKFMCLGYNVRVVWSVCVEDFKFITFQKETFINC